jgi:hypothetical protein
VDPSAIRNIIEQNPGAKVVTGPAWTIVSPEVQQQYGPPDFQPVTEAKLALADIKKNRGAFLSRVSNSIYSMLKECPPTGSNVPTDLTDSDFGAIANAFADVYVSNVERFLQSNPGANPAQAVRPEETAFAVRTFFSALPVIGKLIDPPSGQERFDAVTNCPVCEDWAAAMYGMNLSREVTLSSGKAVKLQDVITISWGQHVTNTEMSTFGIMTFGQHNFAIISPAGHRPAAPPNSDTSLRVIDPWITLRPNAYSVTNYPHSVSYVGKDIGDVNAQKEAVFKRIENAMQKTMEEERRAFMPNYN